MQDGGDVQDSYGGGDDPRDRMNAVIRRLRQDPEEYKELRGQFMALEDDRSRVDLLVDFAVNDKELSELIPGGIQPGGGELAATITTVTVTTVTIASSAY